MKKPHAFLCILPMLCLCMYSSYSQDLKQYNFGKPAMGTQLNISLYATSAQKANETVQAAFERVEQLNAILSDYDPQSEINRLCQEANFNTWTTVSDDLFNILYLSKKISRSTKGSFDVTMGKYTRLWRISRREKKLPLEEELKRVKTFGYDDIYLRKRDKAVKIKSSEILLDFGGIAKGYTAEQILILLKENQIKHALIDFGGDITVSNAPPNKKGWNIKIAYNGEEGKVSETLSVNNLSIATSGDLYQKVSINGETYSHIINPTTGLGITHPIQITVIAKSGALADSYATAFSVMGIVQIKKFLKKRRNQEVHVLISYVENEMVKVWKSEHFDDFRLANE